MKNFNERNGNVFSAVLLTFLLMIVIVCICCLPSCGLTRIASTEAKYYQRGDTTVQIITKTTTTIDADTKVPVTSLIH